MGLPISRLSTQWTWQTRPGIDDRRCSSTHVKLYMSSDLIRPPKVISQSSEDLSKTARSDYGCMWKMFTEGRPNPPSDVSLSNDVFEYSKILIQMQIVIDIRLFSSEGWTIIVQMKLEWTRLVGNNVCWSSSRSTRHEHRVWHPPTSLASPLFHINTITPLSHRASRIS